MHEILLYPTGKCEVVFQHMAIRNPLDDVYNQANAPVD
jgi:hypothetical protein